MKKITKTTGLISIAVFWLAVGVIKFISKEPIALFLGFFWASILTAIVLAGINWSGGHDRTKAS